MAACDLSDDVIDARMNMLEKMIIHGHLKDLPYLNAMFHRLLDEQVRRDLEREDVERNRKV